MAKKPDTKKPALSKKQIKERAEAHPLAVPFLWLGKHKVQNNFIFVPLIGTIVFSILGYFYPLHHPAPWDKVPMSYAIFGFLAYSFVVICSWPLFKLLGRDENYYGEGDDD